jgi:hypothetical protein
MTVFPNNQIEMRCVIAVVLALTSFVGVAVATQAFVTTYYTDTACSVQAAASLGGEGVGIVNPFVAPFGACVKYSSVSYVKVTACSGTTATSVFYTDSGCTQNPYSNNFAIAPCNPVSDPQGVAAFISKCTTISSASSFSMTFLSGVAATLAFCL